MAGIIVALVIALPWLGALVVWLARNKHPRLQHTLAVLFSVLTAIASLVLIQVRKFRDRPFKFRLEKHSVI